MEGFNQFLILHNFFLVRSVIHIQIVSFTTIYESSSIGPCIEWVLNTYVLKLCASQELPHKFGGKVEYRNKSGLKGTHHPSPLLSFL